KNLVPSEIDAAWKSAIHGTQQIQILLSVQRPAQAAVILLPLDREHFETLRILVEIRCYVRTLIRLRRVAPGALQRLDAEHFGIQAAGIGTNKRVAGVVGTLREEPVDSITGDLG